MYDESGRDTLAFISPPYSGSPSEEEYETMIRALVTGGYVKRPSMGQDMNITLLGVQKVEELRAQRANLPARAQALRKALILWLYGHNMNGTHPTAGADFFQTEHSFFAGQPFSTAEIIRAISHLRQLGLVAGLQSDQSDDLGQPSLTASGIDCAESGKSVSDFVNPEKSSGPTFNVTVDGSQNVVIGTQHDFTQNNTSGIDPSILAQLVHAASTARQSLPALNLSPDDHVLVEQLSNELEMEAAGQAPEPGRLRQLVSSLGDALTSAGGSALGSLVLGAVQQAAAALG
ncbi:hypothetical protein J7E95_40190 [Streptomyces sp. ISL-14]|nr:hypothetical protein [Streptomyces sp. ISL-14]